MTTALTSPLVIYVEDKNKYDPEGDDFNYFAYIAKLIRSCGFSIVYAHDHDVKNDKNGIQAVLARHPEAVAIVSDVDTHRTGAGVEWFTTYSTEQGAKPVFFLSNMPNYKDKLMALGAKGFVQKPFFETEDPSKPDDHPKAAKFKNELIPLLQAFRQTLGSNYADAITAEPVETQRHH